MSAGLTTSSTPMIDPGRSLEKHVSGAGNLSTCLVTGGAGFIGCAMSPGLSKHFGRVVALDNLHPQVHAAGKRPVALDAGVQLMLGDVTDARVWDRLLADIRPTVIVHLAAETGTSQSLTESERHGRVNVCGVTTMLDALTRAGVSPERFVLSSSRAVYGEGAWRAHGGDTAYPRSRSREMLAAGTWDFPTFSPIPSTAGSTCPQPCSVYGATKLAQEHVLGAWCAAVGAELSVLRLQNVYGPGQSLTNSYTGIVSLFCRLARENREVPIYEDGAMLRDFIFIDDVAAALVAAARGPRLAAPLDIGTGVAFPIGEIARKISDHYRAPAPCVTGQYRYGDVRHAACDISATLLALPDWRPRFSLDQGMLRLIDWIETQLEGVMT